MIVDTHVHIGSIMNFHMPKEYVTYMVKKYNIDFAIVSNCECAECDHNQNPIPKELRTDQITGTKEALSFAKESDGKIGVAVWCCVRNETATKKLYSLIEENRKYIYALKFHPFHSAVYFDDPKMEPFFTLAEHFSLPVILHTGGSVHSQPKYIENTAKKHPKINFVLAHMGLGSDNKEYIDLVSKYPNLYADTTWVSVESTLSCIKKCGSEKIVFGSDSPIDGKDTYLFNKSGERSLYQQYFNEFKEMVSKEDYENIMHKNAERLFNIKVKK